MHALHSKVLFVEASELQHSVVMHQDAHSWEPEMLSNAQTLAAVYLGKWIIGWFAVCLVLKKLYATCMYFGTAYYWAIL